MFKVRVGQECPTLFITDTMKLRKSKSRENCLFLRLRDDAERVIFRNAMRDIGYNKTKTAEYLGIDRKTFTHALTRLGLKYNRHGEISKTT